MKMSGNWKTIKQNGKNQHVNMNGKNRKKPFGIQKDMAKKDVDLLRKEGKRARLIETNRRLDLYAPYEANIQSPTPSVPQPEPTPSIQKAAPSSENNESVNADNVPIVTHEAEMAKKLISSVTPDKEYSPYTIYSKDGKTYVLSVDNSHIAMYYAEINGVTQKPEEPVGQRIRIPTLDLESHDALVSELLEPEQKQLLKELSEIKKAKNEPSQLTIYKPEGREKAYMCLINTDKWDPIVLGDPIPISIKQSGWAPFISYYPYDYFSDAIKGLRHIDKELGMKQSNISIRLKEDYPILISTGNNTINYNTLIAPRMENNSIRISSAIDKAIKEGVSA